MENELSDIFNLHSNFGVCNVTVNIGGCHTNCNSIQFDDTWIW